MRTLALSCAEFGEGEVDEKWASGEAAMEVLRLFHAQFHPCSDVRVSTSRLYTSSITGPNLKGENVPNAGEPTIGPLQYFGNPAIVALLKDERDMTLFGERLLLKLTDDFTSVDTVEIDDRLHAIRSKLRNAGFKTLDQGIDRAEWDCRSESARETEKERKLLLVHLLV